MADGSEPIYCEVCRLPHRRGVARCEDCGHWLGRDPDWAELRGELSHLRGRIALGILALAAMIALNQLIFQGVGYILLTAPIGWAVFGAYKYTILSRRLKAVGQR